MIQISIIDVFIFVGAMFVIILCISIGYASVIYELRSIRLWIEHVNKIKPANRAAVGEPNSPRET